MKRYWEIIADNLSKAGWSWGCVSALDCEGRTTWIVDAHRDDGNRFVMRADEILTAFMELQAVTTQYDQSCWFRGRQFLQSKTQRTPSRKTIITLLKRSKRMAMQYLILLAVVSALVLYVLIIAGCLCYVGRHSRRTF